MAYKKIKEERYQNFGGINTKISQYLNGPMEFLALENVDFQTPGSLTERWGSTQYFGASLTAKVNGLYEFNQTSGASYFYAVAGGTLGLALNGGFSSIFAGSTSGGSYLNYTGSGSGWTLGNFDFDFDTLQNQCFLANQKAFMKTTGFSVFFFGLPRFQCGSTNGYDNIFLETKGTSVASGFTGYFYYKLAWTNSYGMAGTPSVATTLGTSDYFLLTAKIAAAGASSIYLSFTGATSTTYNLVPPNFDISGVGVFRSGPTATDLTSGLTNFTIQKNFEGNTYRIYNAIENLDYTLVGTIGVSAGSVSATFVDSNVAGGITFLNKNILPWMWYPTSDQASFPNPTLPVGTGVTLVPKFIETHDNRLFIAGMSTSLSTFYFSEFGEPEHFEADFAFEVRTNDGSGITGLKEYSGNLMIFKTKSFHQLSTAADDFANWVLTPVSTEYGCLSNRAVTTYANMLVFLDTKGVIRYNGSNIEILSTKIDPIFQRMNVSAAQTQAQMTYDKQRNEILCDIPVDGSTMNNLTVVYDIIAGAWTTYSGYRPAITTVAQGQLTNKQVFYGGYSGLVSYFGSSFTSDNGTAFTTIIKSGFLTDLGNSTQKVFRRLWLDTSPLGASAFIDVHFYQDYGASIIVGATMPLTPFQNRIDFGVSAKSLSVEFIKNSTFRLALHGFSIAYRFQRNV